MRYIVAVIAFLFIAAVHAQVAVVGSINPSNPTPQVTVTANLSSTSVTIPSNFVGIRGEVGDFVAGLYQGTTGSNGSFMNIAKLLGSNGVFALGGNSAENATAPTITSTMANNLNSFVTGIGTSWTLSYDLDSVANNSSAAATTATTIATALGTANVVFQFGNEPTTNWTQANYITLWNSYYTAVTGAVSGVKLSGVDDGMGPGSMTLAIPSLTGGLSGLQYVSSHFYTDPICGVNLPFTQLLSNVYNAYNGTPPFQNFVSWVSPNKQRMTETNTICDHGFPGGESDRFISSTWYIDVAMVLASAGWLGTNTQNYYLGQAYYNIANLQVDGNYLPAPIFYGMFLFSKIEGQQIVQSTITGPSTVTAIATKGTNGNANMIVANNDTVRQMSITPAQSSGWTSANVLAVKPGANQGCSDSTAKIGGQAIGESGSWSGTASAITNGQSIMLGPCESALIQILP